MTKEKSEELVVSTDKTKMSDEQMDQIIGGLGTATQFRYRCTFPRCDFVTNWSDIGTNAYYSQLCWLHSKNTGHPEGGIKYESR